MEKSRCWKSTRKSRLKSTDSYGKSTEANSKALHWLQYNQMIWPAFLSVCLSVFRSLSLIFLSLLDWPGFHAREGPQSKSARIHVMIFVAIPLCGALVISAVIAWYFWQKRKLRKSAPPRALILDTIERSGSSTKPRNEYVFLPQSWGACLVTMLKPSRGLHTHLVRHYNC